MYFMAVKKSRKQVLFSDFNIHIQKTRDRAFKGIKKLRQYSVNLPVKQCFEKKPVAQGNLLMPQPAQQAAWKQLQWAQEKTVFTPRVSPARAPVISFAHYFQATNVFDKLDILGLPIRKGKAFQHTERKNKQTNKQFCRNFAMSRGIPRSLVIQVSPGWIPLPGDTQNTNVI